VSDWIEHRRGDRELLGWMRPQGEGFVVIDLLGREISDELDWLDAEELLEQRGIGYLADRYELQLDGGHWLLVRIVEVSPHPREEGGLGRHQRHGPLLRGGVSDAGDTARARG